LFHQILGLKEVEFEAEEVEEIRGEEVGIKIYFSL